MRHPTHDWRKESDSSRFQCNNCMIIEHEPGADSPCIESNTVDHPAHYGGKDNPSRWYLEREISNLEKQR